VSDHDHPDLPAERVLLTDFFHQFPFFKLLGMELLECEPGRSVIRLPFRDDLCQPAGIIHGGTIASLVDTGMAQAILLTNDFRERRKTGGGIVSLDLRVKYFRPVNSGHLIAVSTAPRIGKRVIHTESIVTNDQGKEVAKADAIFMGVDGVQISGPRG